MTRSFCTVCNYEHKERPISFCESLHSKKGIMSIDRDQFMSEFMEQFRKLK